MVDGELIWYVSYGSNLSSERFRVYLEGGTAQGRTRAQVGSRDRSLWRADRGVTLGHQLMFAGRSRWWGGGGVAFVDPELSDAETLGRAYLITAQQFQDVLAQESRREVGTEVDLTEALTTGSAVLGEGFYDRVLLVGHDEHPMLTFTTPGPVTTLDQNAPSEAYAGTIAAGLIDCHGLSPHEAEAYIARHSP